MRDARKRPAARCARGLRELSRLEIRGRGECRMRAAPAVPCAKWAKKTHTSIQVQRRQSDIPCAMALRLISCSPRRSGLFDTVACEYGCQSPVGMTGLRRLDANHGGVRTTRLHRTLQRRSSARRIIAHGKPALQSLARLTLPRPPL